MSEDGGKAEEKGWRYARIAIITAALVVVIALVMGSYFLVTVQNLSQSDDRQDATLAEVRDLQDQQTCFGRQLQTLLLDLFAAGEDPPPDQLAQIIERFRAPCQKGQNQ
jgi:hypothetical protein